MEQALIIGGSTGIGKATAALLLHKGIEVIIAGRNQQSLEKAHEDLRRNGGNVRTFKFDLADTKAFHKEFRHNSSRIKISCECCRLFFAKILYGSYRK